MPAGQLFFMLATSFFPLAFLILAVLGSILFGLATPSEAAAIGALGGLVLAAGYRALTWQRLREGVYLTVRTTAMVCWLFVGSSRSPRCSHIWVESRSSGVRRAST